MERVFISPPKYVQGKDALFNSKEHLENLGEAPLLISDDVVYDIVGEKFVDYLKENGFNVKYEAFNGEASTNEIERIAKLLTEGDSDFIIALGGGKTIDTGKAVADEAGVSLAVLPTVASTDAPTSGLSVIYTNEGAFEKYLFYDKNPDLVLLDTAVIANAPAQLLASGIADALATYVESRAITEAKGNTMAGGVPTIAAQAIAEKSVDVLFEKAELAIAANRAKVVTESLEDIVEANTLLSGLGFESGGLAAAHAIHNGFTALDGDVHKLSHGEKVAYGTLTQLILENRDIDEIDRYISLYQALGLPTTLEDLHLGDASYEDLLKVAELATSEGETIHEMRVKYTKEDVANALLAADEYVKSLNELLD